MWDDLVIGKHPKMGGTAYIIRQLPKNCHVSENTHAYWIANAYLGFGMKIERDTEEGRSLAKLLMSVEDKPIEKFLTDLVLTRGSHAKIKSKIDAQIKEAFEKGRRSKTDEIRKTLGL